MRLIGEIYMVPCPYCSKECKVTVFPNTMDAMFVPEDEAITTHPSYLTGNYNCYNCGREIVLPYKIITVGYQTWNTSMKNDLTEASQILYRLTMSMKQEECKL